MMASPGKRPMAFIAEYQFGDDNLLTATHHEEMRLKNEERVRNAKSILKLEGLTVCSGDLSPTHNLKRIQQEQDRKGEIDQHNLILLQRLERIHHQLPKQFDVSHHSEAIQNAPRASNAGLRRRQQEKIEQENQRMKRRLNGVKGTFDLKKLATDAERHNYFCDQLSKVGRRRKAQETCKQLSDSAATKSNSTSQAPEQFYVFQHQSPLPMHGQRFENNTAVYEDEFEEGDDENDRYKDHIDIKASAASSSWKLPPVMSSSSRKYMKSYASSPTVAKSTKVISAADLLHGFK